jgi:hypothetical protein
VLSPFAQVLLSLLILNLSKLLWCLCQVSEDWASNHSFSERWWRLLLECRLIKEGWMIMLLEKVFAFGADVRFDNVVHCTDQIRRISSVTRSVTRSTLTHFIVLRNVGL